MIQKDHLLYQSVQQKSDQENKTEDKRLKTCLGQSRQGGWVSSRVALCN